MVYFYFSIAVKGYSVVSRSFSLGYNFIPDTLGSVTIQVFFLVKQA